MKSEVEMTKGTDHSQNAVLLVNANPFTEDYMSSYGLEIMKSYIMQQHQDRYQIEIVNPFHENSHPIRTIVKTIKEIKPILIGISIRNFDNAYTVEDVKSSKVVDTQYYLRKVKRLVQAIKNTCKGIPVVGGGVTFSYYPEMLMNYLGLDYGIVGPGEYTFGSILDLLAKGKMNRDSLLSLPGMALRSQGKIFVSKEIYNLENEVYFDVKKDDAFEMLYRFPKRRFPGYLPYQFPVRTHYGCGMKCTYCVEALNCSVCYRPVENVVSEIEYLVENYGCKRVFFANGEMNLTSQDFVLDLCKLMIKKGLNKKIKWTSFFNITPFTMEMATLMKDSGCDYIAFSVDNFHDKILKNLNKNFTSEDISRTLDICEVAKLATESGVIFGAPGDSKEITDYNISRMRHYFDRGHLFKPICGLRVYPDTLLHKYVVENNFENTFRNNYSNKENLQVIEPIIYCSWSTPKGLLSYLQNEFKDMDQQEYLVSSEEKADKLNFNRMMMSLSKGDVLGAQDILNKLISQSKTNVMYNYFFGEYFSLKNAGEKARSYIEKALESLEVNGINAPIEQAIYYQARKLRI